MTIALIVTVKKIARLALGRPVSWFREYERWQTFKHDFALFSALSENTMPRFRLDWQDRCPRLNERTATTGFDQHYVYHTAWAARIIAQSRPPYHVDISSSLYFGVLVSAFVPVKFYDYRPAELSLSNFSSERADLVSLPFADGGIDSLSCMHVVEHIGLGRYGDALEPNGDLKAMAELKRVLAPGGSLLFVVPVGKPKIMFNAHRIYSYDQIASAFAGLRVRQFALIPDNGGLIENAAPELVALQNYGCGCFWFEREI